MIAVILVIAYLVVLLLAMVFQMESIYLFIMGFMTMLVNIPIYLLSMGSTQIYHDPYNIMKDLYTLLIVMVEFVFFLIIIKYLPKKPF